MATIATAQMIADHPQALVVSLPKNFPMCSVEAGSVAGSAPWDVVRTRPYRTNDVPSVAMNDGSPSVTVRNALIAPTARPKISVMMMARITGTPS